MEKQIDLLHAQEQFLSSSHRHTGLVAGFGSGKTQAGIIKIILKKLQYRNTNVAYYLPTYNLIEDIAVPRISEQLTNLGLNFTVNVSKKFFEIFNNNQSLGKIIMRTMDNPSLIIGYEVGYSLIDECDVLPKEKMSKVFKQIVARNRAKLPNDEKNQTDVVGTPEGFKWFYDFFVKNKTANKNLIKAKTKDNPYLTDSYIDALKESHTPQELEAYLDGEFVNLTSGSVFHHFNRIVNYSDRTIKANDTLHVGMDFNITKMSLVVHVFDNGNLFAVDEITNAYDTNEACQLLKSKYPKHKIVIYPDASGDSRKTSSDTTDHQIIKKSGFTLITEKSNPSVKDRISATNIAFKNNDQVSKYFVNSNNCPTYTEALEQLTYKNGVPDKSSGHDHVADAGTYCAYFFFKIKEKKQFRIVSS